MKDLQTGTPPLPHEIDPFLIEVIRHALSAAAEEMSLVMTRSARSSVLREGGDLSSTITDADGELAAQGRDLHMHLGVMAYTVKHFLSRAVCLILLPALLYITFFYIHLRNLYT